MGILTVPERGQPLDVAYIGTIVDAINTLSNNITLKYNYTSIDTPSSSNQKLKTSEVKMVGGAVNIVSGANVAAATSQTFSYPFPNGDFKYAPIVTASPINIGQTSAGEQVTVVLTSVTRSSVSGIVRFNAAGTVSVTVNLIAIGISS